MRRGERTVKGLDAEFAGVLLETRGAHQRDSTKPSHIGVVQSSAIIELESHRRIAQLVPAKAPIVDEKRAGESRLHDESVAGVEIEHYELGPAPAPDDRCVLNSFCEGARIHLAQYVALPNGNFFYRSPADRAVQIARDGLGLR